MTVGTKFSINMDTRSKESSIDYFFNIAKILTSPVININNIELTGRPELGMFYSMYEYRFNEN